MIDTTMQPALNVLDEPLQLCSEKPLTGFFRDGYCNTCAQDHGSHTICVQLTHEFLTYSKAAGNDLMTPRPQWNFPGLQAGQRWCLCATRWLQAYQNDCAPRVLLASTHKRALEVVTLEQLSTHALDLN